MDELDREIVTELQRDARQTNRQLAQRMGIAPSTCFERVRRLHEREVIRGYHAEVDLAAIGRAVQALVFAQVRPLRRDLIDAFQREASAMPEVMSVFVLAGGGDFLLHVGVPGVEQLHAFLIDRLSGRREVTGFRTSVIFRHVRNPAVSVLADVTGDGHQQVTQRLRGRADGDRRAGETVRPGPSVADPHRWQSGSGASEDVQGGIVTDHPHLLGPVIADRAHRCQEGAWVRFAHAGLLGNMARRPAAPAARYGAVSRVGCPLGRSREISGWEASPGRPCRGPVA